MPRKQKLELTWIGKENRPRLEPRILLEDPEKSYHAEQRNSAKDYFDNRLIHGDNLLALKALEQEFAGKIKCIYIDPPYNTGSAFEHYEDGIEHSLWLNMMRDRLEVLRNLLRNDGSIWISIDDNEMPYLRLLLDETFGRRNFVAQCIWQKVYSPKSSARFLSDMHDYVVCYARDSDVWNRNLLPRSHKQDKAYKNPDNDPRGPWKSSDLSARNYYSQGTYPITTPSGRHIEGPPQGRYWSISKNRLDELDNENRVWWGKNGDNVPSLKRFLTDVKDGVVPQTIWFYDEVGHNQSAKQHLKALLPDEERLFVTPKPEGLIERIIHIASNRGDWILDSFAGTGTTGAAAQKMSRRWIMVELGDHCDTHIIPRLHKVIDGRDPGGITDVTSWDKGGGFRYYTLAPSLLQEDEFGNWIINKKYNPEMLTEAMCKLEGFNYAPSNDLYWMHGQSTESDFIYVTTQTLTREQLVKLSDEVGPNRSLLICCSAFRVRKLEDFPNLTLKKIPLAVMSKCEWGKDDYSLEIASLPAAPEPVANEVQAIEDDLPKNKRKARKALDRQQSLFDDTEPTE